MRLQSGSFVRILAGPYIGKQAVVVHAVGNMAVVQVAVYIREGRTDLRQTHVGFDQLRPLTWTPRTGALTQVRAKDSPTEAPYHRSIARQKR